MWFSLLWISCFCTKCLPIKTFSNDSVLDFSGSRSGSIHHHDVRVAEHHVATLSNHSQEICGLSWSPDGRYLASGGNDNVLSVWPNHISDEVPPLYTLTHHQAAVKVITMSSMMGQCGVGLWSLDGHT